jgi:2-dehydro-3-deoxyphosphooctonate aldolase (KDO 8-P synthase)
VEKEVRVGQITFGAKPFVFIGGPCVIEGREITLRTAERLCEITKDLGVPFVFKSSYDKANRTTLSSYRGPGLQEGLDILKEVGDRLGVPVLTDVHSPEEARRAASVADILQVPALLSRQTDLLIACGETGKAVNIKKGQFLSPDEIGYAVQKVESTGNRRILLTERGTFFGYHHLVNDFKAIPVMKRLGYPVVFDATHSVQLPGAASGVSGGEREFVFPLARAAVAVGIDALFMEVHENPAKAWCDGANSVDLKDVAAMLAVLRRIEEAV